METNKVPYLVIAENDADSRLIYQEVIAATDFQVEYQFVESGSELLDHLKNRRKARPCLVFLDLDLSVHGHDALEQMMEDEKTRFIPVIVITTEEEENEAWKAYANCANSYIIKPGDFQLFVDMLNKVFSYWFETVKMVS
jgi:CheY-like chemotaxis protein